MIAILQKSIFKYIFLKETFCVSVHNSLKFVPWGPIDNVMNLHRRDYKPFPETMMTKFIEAYRYHQAQCTNTVIGVNLLGPKQNGCHFADDVFKRIFYNENVWISLKISMKFVPKAPINNIPALVQMMAWRRPGDKPLSEPMMVNLLIHVCVARPQWVNQSVNCWWNNYTEGVGNEFI